MMGFYVVPRVSIAALALVVATGCSSLPSPVRSAENLTVTFVDCRGEDPSRHTTLMLVNDTNPEYQDIYSQPRKDGSIKLAPMDMVTELVTFANDHAFFEYAQEIAPGEVPDRTNAVGMITIGADARSYLFLLKYGEGKVNRDKVQAFTDIQREIALQYNQVSSLQFISTSAKDGNYFENEQKRIDAENKRSKTKKANE